MEAREQPAQGGGYVTIIQGWATEAPHGIVPREKGQAGHQQCPKEPRLKRQGAEGWDGGAEQRKATRLCAWENRELCRRGVHRKPWAGVGVGGQPGRQCSRSRSRENAEPRTNQTADQGRGGEPAPAARRGAELTLGNVRAVVLGRGEGGLNSSKTLKSNK